MTAIKDSVHDHIEVQGIGAALLETPPMQRLRRITQLGTAPLVYPSATHTRFEHSLGVYDLTARAVESLGVPDRTARTVRAAALLHDVGHPPFSHSLEPLLERYTGHSHDDVSHLIGSGEVAAVLERHSIDPDRVATLISGGGRYGQLLAGDLDVDRMDYLSRDALHTGVPYGTIDIERLLRALQFDDGNLVLEEGNVQTAESLLIARALMNPTVYYHHVTRIARAMLQRATLRLLEAGTTRPETVARMDDPELRVTLRNCEGARSLVERLDERRLYKRAIWAEHEDVGRDRVEELRDSPPNRLHDLEVEIAEVAGVDRDAVLLDLQGPPAMQEATTKVTVNAEIRELGEQSTLVDALERAQLEQWRLGVYAPAELTESVGAAAERVLGLDIDGARITDIDPPVRAEPFSEFEDAAE
jgi:HD superfamily phosphohydrolase